MITVSSCGVELQEVLSVWVKKAKTLDTRALLWLFSTFITFFFFLLEFPPNLPLHVNRYFSSQTIVMAALLHFRLRVVYNCIYIYIHAGQRKE